MKGVGLLIIYLLSSAGGTLGHDPTCSAGTDNTTPAGKSGGFAGGFGGSSADGGSSCSLSG